MSLENENIEDVFDESAEDVELEDQGQEEVEKTPEEKTSTLSPDAIAEAVARGMSNAQGQQGQGQAPKELSQEELDKALKVYKYGPDYAKALIEELRSEEPDYEAVAALLNSSHQASMEQARTYAVELVKAALAQVDSRISPLAGTLQQQQQASLQKTFLAQYPQLKAYEKLMPMVSNSLLQSGVTFKTQEEAFKALAKAAETQIKQFQPDFVLGAKAGNSKRTRPNSVAFGGHGGGSGGGKSTSGKAAAIWD